MEQIISGQSSGLETNAIQPYEATEELIQRYLTHPFLEVTMKMKISF